MNRKPALQDVGQLPDEYWPPKLRRALKKARVSHVNLLSQPPAANLSHVASLAPSTISLCPPLSPKPGFELYNPFSIRRQVSIWA